VKTFKTDHTYDLVLGSNHSLVVHNDLAAVTQSAEESMRTRLGEMIHNVDQGIPFDSVLWGGTPNVAQFEASGRARLMQVPNVLQVASFTARMSGEVLGYVATIKTPWGEVTLSG
jgi:hypothetical protein